MDIGRILRALERLYGRLPSPPRDPFGFYVWEVLSHQATPRQAEAAMQALKRLPALTPDAIHRAPRSRIQAAVGLSGSYIDSRLQALDAGVRVFRRTRSLTFGVPMPLRKARRSLLPVPHLGRPAVRRMLLFAGDYPVFPIDTRIERLFTRLGAVDASSAPGTLRRRLRRAIVSALPRTADAYRHAFLYFSHHGATTCTDIPHCRVCPLLDQCLEGQARTSQADGTARRQGKRA